MLELKVTLTDAQTQRIAELAATHGRSPEDEAIDLIRQEISRMDLRAERFRRAVEITAMTPKDRVQTDSTILVREEREK
jgi:antitoxin FitA